MTRLSVNVNKIATLRNTRDLDIPNLVSLSHYILHTGADGITIHPRPDQRHIRTGDVKDLAELLKAFPSREFNIEGNPFHEYMKFVGEFRPNQCTLVPDEPGAPTSDHGWDLSKPRRDLAQIIQDIHDFGCKVSLFMDPTVDGMKRAAEHGADRVELYTGPYARNPALLPHYIAAAKAAHKEGLEVNAGHDLNLQNLGKFLYAMPDVHEVSIGHALIADCIEMGISKAVKKYLRIAHG